MHVYAVYEYEFVKNCELARHLADGGEDETLTREVSYPKKK